MSTRMKALRPLQMRDGGVIEPGPHGEFLEDDPQVALELERQGKARRIGPEERQIAGPTETQDKKASEVKATPRWTLRQSPAEYLKQKPSGELADLARQLLAGER